MLQRAIYSRGEPSTDTDGFGNYDNTPYADNVITDESPLFQKIPTSLLSPLTMIERKSMSAAAANRGSAERGMREREWTVDMVTQFEATLNKLGEQGVLTYDNFYNTEGVVGRKYNLSRTQLVLATLETLMDVEMKNKLSFVYRRCRDFTMRLHGKQEPTHEQVLQTCKDSNLEMTLLLQDPQVTTWYSPQEHSLDDGKKELPRDKRKMVIDKVTGKKMKQKDAPMNKIDPFFQLLTWFLVNLSFTDDGLSLLKTVIMKKDVDSRTLFFVYQSVLGIIDKYESIITSRLVAALEKYAGNKGRRLANSTVTTITNNTSWKYRHQLMVRVLRDEFRILNKTGNSPNVIPTDHSMAESLVVREFCRVNNIPLPGGDTLRDEDRVILFNGSSVPANIDPLPEQRESMTLFYLRILPDHIGELMENSPNLFPVKASIIRNPKLLRRNGMIVPYKKDTSHESVELYGFFGQAVQIYNNFLQTMLPSTKTTHALHADLEEMKMRLTTTKKRSTEDRAEKRAAKKKKLNERKAAGEAFLKQLDDILASNAPIDELKKSIVVIRKDLHKYLNEENATSTKD